MDPCKYSAKTQNDLLKHLKNHEKKQNFHCQLCQQKFRTSYGLQCHLESVHAVKAKDEYVCHICGPEKIFGRGIYLSRHLTKEHKMQRPMGQKFSYIQAEDNKFYLAQDEYREIVTDNSTVFKDVPSIMAVVEGMSYTDEANALSFLTSTPYPDR